MLTFKRFLVEGYVHLSKQGNSLNSRAFDKDGAPHSTTVRHISRDVLPTDMGKQEKENVIAAAFQGLSPSFLPTHSLVLSDHVVGISKGMHVAPFAISIQDGNFHVHARAVDSEGMYDEQAPLVKIRTSKLSKPKGVKNMLAKEQQQLESINSQISKIKQDHGIDHLKLVVGEHVYHVSEFKNTPGTPKSDIHTITATDSSMPDRSLHISLKDGNSPRDVQQYGGLTHAKIFNHPEVQQFLQDAHKKFGSSMDGHKGIYFRHIRDPKLKSMLVFGYEHGSSKYGLNNVQLFGQGHPQIVPHPEKQGHWMINFPFQMHNHEQPTGDYEPALYIRKQENTRRTVIERGIDSKEPTKVIAGSRAGGYPMGGLSNTAKPL